MGSKLKKIRSGLFIPDPGSRIRMLTFSHHGSDPGFRGQKGTQSRILIRNAAFNYSKWTTILNKFNSFSWPN